MFGARDDFRVDRVGPYLWARRVDYATLATSAESSAQVRERVTGV